MNADVNGNTGAARRQIALAAGLVALALLGIAVGRLAPGGVAATVQAVTAAIRQAGAAGPALFALAALLAAVSGAIPASLLAIAAGAAFGLVPGFLVMAVGNLAGATVAFGLSRSVFRSAIERLLARRGRLRDIDEAVSREGWKFVGLLRLSPVMPFSATSYLLGLSAVSLPGYLLGTLAALPALFGYVFIGTLTGVGLAAWSGGGNPIRWVVLGVGGAATLALLGLVGRRVLRCPAPAPAALAGDKG